MVAFPFRMGAGSAGDVSRSHPASVVPRVVDSSNPPTLYGGLVLFDDNATNGVRAPASGDASFALVSGAGLVVRPYPFQQQATASYGSIGFGAGTPPTQGIIDICESGYVVAKVNGSPVLGAPVYVWCAASTGSHVQGGFETAPSSGNTLQLDAKTTFGSPADANGLAEIRFNI